MVLVAIRQRQLQKLCTIEKGKVGNFSTREKAGRKNGVLIQCLLHVIDDTAYSLVSVCILHTDIDVP